MIRTRKKRGARTCDFRARAKGPGRPQTDRSAVPRRSYSPTAFCVSICTIVHAKSKEIEYPREGEHSIVCKRGMR